MINSLFILFLPNVSKVINLIRTRFSNFLIEDNLIVSHNASNEDFLVVDNAKNILIIHDFKTNVNTSDPAKNTPTQSKGPSKFP